MDIVCQVNRHARDKVQGISAPGDFSSAQSGTARGFLGRFAGYEPTPLVGLPAKAKEFGVSQILVKDEALRFGLKAFKVTGGALAAGMYLAERLGRDIRDLTPGKELAEEIRARWGPLTFISATSGNHGTGLAWVSRQLGQRAIIYVPAGTAEHRKTTLTKLGAEVIETDVDYDETVELVRLVAEDNDYVIISDTGWEGYEKVPRWIMQGYTVIFDEVREQLAKGGFERPTHVILQGGVGSFSGAAAGYFSSLWGDKRPTLVVVEPASAACLMESARQADGRAHRSREKINTVMAGLGCAEPNPVAWPILFDYADYFISCRDAVAEEGMRVYARPTGKDVKIISGASGAVGMGLLYHLMTGEEYWEIKEELGISKDSRILLFNTEGDTDPEHYNRIVREQKTARIVL